MLKGKKVLITGLTGNTGGTIAEALAPHNELWGLARYSREGQREFWERMNVRTVVGDYAKKEFDELPDDFDYVLHIAANTRPDTVEQGLKDNSDGVAYLMDFCRKAKAFLHVSTAGVYNAPKRDPESLFSEDDALGGGSIGFYTGTKQVGEGAVRAMSEYLNLPTVICRLAVQYGKYKYGGMPGMFLDFLLAGKPVPLRSGWSNRHSLISNDDLAWMIEPLLSAASVPATTLNWGGDVAVPAVEMIEYLAALAGVEPQWIVTDDGLPSLPVDPARRLAVTGPCRVDWKDGLKEMYESLIDVKRANLASAS